MGYISNQPKELKETDTADFLATQVFGSRHSGSHKKTWNGDSRLEYYSDNAIFVRGEKQCILGRDAYVSMGFGNAVEFDALVAELKKGIIILTEEDLNAAKNQFEELARMIGGSIAHSEDALEYFAACIATAKRQEQLRLENALMEGVRINKESADPNGPTSRANLSTLKSIANAMGMEITVL